MEGKKEFLTYLYQACEMGKTSTKDLLMTLKSQENKITDKVEQLKAEYEELFEEAKYLLEKNGIDVNNTSIVGKIGTMMGIKMKMMKDNSDPSVADMLISGYTMGILEITKKLKKYKKDIDSEDEALAKRFIKNQQKNIKELKKYL